MRRLIAMLSLLLGLAGGFAHAGVSPSPGPGDPRMRVAPYDPEQVVELVGDLGYQLTITFAPDERIENVAVGDALGWQITPNRKADLLFIKPIDQAARTNMTVVTNQRRYNFELSVRKGPPTPSQITFGLRFLYPPAPPEPVLAPPPAPRPPEVVNAAYSYEGATGALPSRIFDDGKSTYLQFAEADDYPAIFAVGADGKEAVINFTVREGYLVVDKVERGFILRRGPVATRIYNDGFRETQPGPLSPKPHVVAPARKNWFSR